MDLAALETRIMRLEDIEAIKQLKARYCEICDNDHNPDEIVTIFTTDGIWEGRGIGTATGHAEIRQLFEGFAKKISFSQHMVMNPIIEVEAETATARWYFFGPFTFRQDQPQTRDQAQIAGQAQTKGQAMWQSTRYHETYVKVDGVWKIKHLKTARPGMSAEYEKGWG